MKKIVAIAFALIALPGFAQKEGLVVTYDKTFYWIKIFDKLNYLSVEEKSRIQTSWGANDEGDKSKGKLLVTADQSKFVDMEQEADGGYRGRKSEYMVFRDFAKGTKIEVEEFAGKLYVIEDSLVTPPWKVMNKIKDGCFRRHGQRPENYRLVRKRPSVQCRPGALFWSARTYTRSGHQQR
jgi:GLPGLI family protein